MSPTNTGTTAQTHTATAATNTNDSTKPSLSSTLWAAYKAHQGAAPPTTKLKKRSLFDTVQSLRGLHRTTEPTGTTEKTKTTNSTVNTTSSAPPPPPRPTSPTQTSPTQTGNSTTAPGSKQPLEKTSTTDNTTLTSLVRSWIPSRQKAMYILGGVVVGATMLGGLGWYLDQSSPTANTALSSGLGTARLSDLSGEIGSRGTGSTIAIPARELRLDTTADTLELARPLRSSINSARSVGSASSPRRRGGGGRRRVPARGRNAEPQLLNMMSKCGSLVWRGSESVFGGAGDVVRMFGAGRELTVPALKKGGA